MSNRTAPTAHAAAWLAPWLTALWLAVPAPSAFAESATPQVVSTCADDGPGSLRRAIIEADSGDTIDLTDLPCSSIQLLHGPLTISPATADLTIIGPENHPLVVHGGSGPWAAFRIIDDLSPGTLTISDMTLMDAVPGPPNSEFGGCIKSQGDVTLMDVVLTNCVATSWGGVQARGGALYAAGDVDLMHVVVLDNHAVNLGTGDAVGGGIYAGGALYMQRCRIEFNSATGFEDPAIGGGAYVNGKLTMIDSQVDNNRASAPFSGNHDSFGGGLKVGGGFLIWNSSVTRNSAYRAAGIDASTYSAPDAGRTIMNSTIASNQSELPPAGVLVREPQHPGGVTLAVWNSTVAFNNATGTTSNGAAGIYFPRGMVSLDSSIVANNDFRGNSSDLKAGQVTGSHNLVRVPHSSVPADTLVGLDPRLGALGNHGGSTLTLALLEGSPAIDTGANPHGRTNDQRGIGFVRVVGDYADIGALESRPADLVLTPASIQFGILPAGSTSAPVTVTVANGGDQPIDISSITPVAAPFVLHLGTCVNPPFTLVANASCTLIIAFAPAHAGPFSQTLSFISNAGDRDLLLAGSGKANDVIFAAGFDGGQAASLTGSRRAQARAR